MATWSGETLTGQLENRLRDYRNVTHQFNNYNEIFNLNMYLKNSSTQDMERLEKTNDMLKSRVIKLKQQYISQERDYNFMGLKNGLMYYTIIVCCFMLIMVGVFLLEMIGLTPLVIIVIIVSVIFILSVIFIIKNNSTRKNLSWDQYYWEPMKK